MRTSSWVAAAVLSLAALACRDQTESPTAPALPPPSANVSSAETVVFWQLSAGEHHTCGVAVDNLAYCWGANYDGELGDGTTEQRLVPRAVAGGRRFRQISAGGTSHACGVTVDYRAYCWGNNLFGQLGDGTMTSRLRPVAVAGGHRFRQIDTRYFFTCAVTYSGNRAFCWGVNDFGQIGDGSLKTDRLVPTPVAGGHRFRQVSTGEWHTCGVTTDDRAYCWGSNRDGQIGDSTNAPWRLTPTRVAGARRYRQVDAGDFHSCAVTLGDRAFCWGNGRSGELGNGKAYLSFWPRAVAGGLSFSRVTAGGRFSCGETTTNRGYCWGSNYDGRLGDGTTTDRLRPVAVLGGLYFGQLSAGWLHTCGKTPNGVGYCWGGNYFGELGDGTTTDRLTPAPIAGPL